MILGHLHASDQCWVNITCDMQDTKGACSQLDCHAYHQFSKLSSVSLPWCAMMLHVKG